MMIDRMINKWNNDLWGVLQTWAILQLIRTCHLQTLPSLFARWDECNRLPVDWWACAHRATARNYSHESASPVRHLLDCPPFTFLYSRCGLRPSQPWYNLWPLRLACRLSPWVLSSFYSHFYCLYLFSGCRILGIVEYLLFRQVFISSLAEIAQRP